MAGINIVTAVVIAIINYTVCLAMTARFMRKIEQKPTLNLRRSFFKHILALNATIAWPIILVFLTEDANVKTLYLFSSIIGVLIGTVLGICSPKTGQSQV